MIQKFLKHKKKIIIVIIFISLLFAIFSNFGGIEYAFAEDALVSEGDSSYFSLGGIFNLASKTLMAPFVGALKIILDILVWLIGQVSTLVIALLFVIAEYNNFINEAIVIRGWVVVRDVCNMFFVLLLLIIAFATILRIPNYEVKKTLPKLLIMAILINFSKTICGLIIDFGQVFMLTFISPFASYTNGVTSFHLGHAGVVQAFHLDKMFSIFNYAGGIWDYATNPGVTVVSTVATMIFGLVLTVIATMIIATFALMLLYRVIVLWILIILSPLAYLAAAFPNFNKYSSQWWSEFIKNVIVGPVMAFFLWLALSISTDNDGSISNATKLLNQETLNSAAKGTEQVVTFSATLSPLGDVNTLLSYLMTAAFLTGGMIAAQQIGGAVGSSSGKIFKGIGKVSGIGADYLNRKQMLGFRIPFSKKRIKGSKIDLNPQRLYQRVSEGFAEGKRKDVRDMDAVAGIGMAEGAKPSDIKRGGPLSGYLRLVRAMSSSSFVDQTLRGPFAATGIINTFRGGARAEATHIQRSEKEKARLEAAQKLASIKKEIREVSAASASTIVKFESSDAYKKLKETIGGKPAEKYRDEIAELVDDKLEKEINERREGMEGERSTAAKLKISDSAGDKVFLGSINEEKSKISTTDEDDIVEHFVAAVERGNSGAASAHFLKASEVGGLNTLLGHLGYSSVDAGFTKERAKELQAGTDEDKAEYEKFRGVNDMVRDYLIGELGMDEQRALALQGEAATINFGNGHLYGAKTIGFENGQRVQKSAEDQREAIITDALKGDLESFVRQKQKAGYGGLDAKGNWKTANHGQEMLLRGWKKIADEIGRNRWNKSAASVVGKEEEIKKLKKLVDDMALKSGKTVEAIFGKAKFKNVDGGDTIAGVKEFLDEVQKYSEQSGDKIGGYINEAMKK